MTKVATIITKKKSEISRLVNSPPEGRPGFVISSPSARARPGGGWGPWVSPECPIVCSWRETPFQRELSPSKLRPREAVAVFDPRAKIAFFDRPFCLPPSRTLRRGFTFRLSPLVRSPTNATDGLETALGVCAGVAAASFRRVTLGAAEAMTSARREPAGIPLEGELDQEYSVFVALGTTCLCGSLIYRD